MTRYVSLPASTLQLGLTHWQATVANSSEKLIREKSTLVATVTFESPPPVAELERVMTYVMKGAPNYKLTKVRPLTFARKAQDVEPTSSRKTAGFSVQSLLNFFWRTSAAA